MGPPDSARPHAYIEITIDGAKAGKLIFELFQSQAADAVNYFRKRCCECSTRELCGINIQKIITGHAIYCNLPKKKISDDFFKTRNTNLHHTEGGLLSLSSDATELVITQTRTLWMDNCYQVIGRLRSGRDFLAKVGLVEVDYNQKPLSKLIFNKSGMCRNLEIGDNFLTSDDE